MVVRAGVSRVLRVQSRGDGYLGNSDPRLHFAFDTSKAVDVEVRWPGGATSEELGVPVDSAITIREP